MRADLVLLGALAPSLAVAETVLGAYLFVRHGDRTAKSTPPTRLTDLGYKEVFMAGSYYRNRYLSNSTSADNNDTRISSLDPDLYSAQSVAAYAPSDVVLQNSATGFLQGLYPPAGKGASAHLRNGTEIESPLNGYQLIALKTVDNGGDSENNAWLQSTSNCPNAEVSSNNYFESKEYAATKKDSDSFYKSLSPMLNRTFAEDDMNFKNAYTIFDYLNVANIHNSSDAFPHSNLLTNKTYDRLLDLANIHEFNLAFNETEPIRAVAGSTLAGQILKALNTTVENKGKEPLNIQFGAYATFLSFFGLANLTSLDDKFTGIPDYASSMSFELVTNASLSGSDDFPDSKDITVRWLFANGTIDSGDKSTEPQAYPLFGESKSKIELPWKDFSSKMKKISIIDQKDWCSKCGSTADSCAASDDDDDSASTSSKSGGHGMSKAVAGVVGAMVTLGAFIVLGGFAYLWHRARSAAAAKKASKLAETVKA